MVLPVSHGISRVPWYSGTPSRKIHSFHLQDYHLLRRAFPGPSTMNGFDDFPRNPQIPPTAPHNPRDTTPAGLTYPGFGLFPFRSPLLWESQLLSFPGGTEMFQFPPFASPTYGFSWRCPNMTPDGFPHSEIPGSKPV
jgi:hypothetical protein